jgi:hypothetical protein
MTPIPKAFAVAFTRTIVEALVQVEKGEEGSRQPAPRSPSWDFLRGCMRPTCAKQIDAAHPNLNNANDACQSSHVHYIHESLSFIMTQSW